MGNFQSVEVGEELTVSSSQSKDCDLCHSVQLVEAVLFCSNAQALSPLVLKLFVRMVFASLLDMGYVDCSNLLPIFDSRSASSLPPTPQWEGIHWRVTDVLFLSRDSSCLMLLKIWSPPGD